MSRYLRPRPGSVRITVNCQDDLYARLIELGKVHDLSNSGICCKLLRSHPEINLPPIHE
jgi:hypothetical protein